MAFSKTCNSFTKALWRGDCIIGAVSNSFQFSRARPEIFERVGQTDGESYCFWYSYDWILLNGLMRGIAAGYTPYFCKLSVKMVKLLGTSLWPLEISIPPVVPLHFCLNTEFNVKPGTRWEVLTNIQ